MERRDQSSGTDAAPVILAIGFDDSIDRTSWGDGRLVTASTVHEVVQTFTRECVALFALGPRLSPLEAHRLLTRRVAEFRASPALNVVCGVGSEAALFQDAIDSD